MSGRHIPLYKRAKETSYTHTHTHLWFLHGELRELFFLVKIVQSFFKIKISRGSESRRGFMVAAWHATFFPLQQMATHTRDGACASTRSTSISTMLLLLSSVLIVIALLRQNRVCSLLILLLRRRCCRCRLLLRLILLSLLMVRRLELCRMRTRHGAWREQHGGRLHRFCLWRRRWSRWCRRLRW